MNGDWLGRFSMDSFNFPNFVVLNTNWTHDGFTGNPVYYIIAALRGNGLVVQPAPADGDQLYECLPPADGRSTGIYTS